jgi:hypothetical protein
MIANNETLTRIAGRAKELGLPDGPIGIRSTLGGQFMRVEDANQPEAPDYIAFANTDDVDLEDEVVDPRGADLSYIRRNAKLFADHQYGTESVVGHIRAFSAFPSPQDHRAWQVKFKLISTEAGRTVRTIIEETGSIGLSVGFIAREFGPPTAEEAKAYTKAARRPRSIIRKWDWFELSATALPANKACQTMGVVYDEKRLGEVESLVTKGLISRKGAAMLGFPVEHRRKFVPVATPRRVVNLDGLTVIRNR